MFPHFLSDSLSSSVGAQFFTIPISVKTFGTFTPIGIFSTVIVSPLVTFFIYSGLICFLLSLIFPLFISTSGIFMNFLYTLITKIVLFFSQFPLIEVFNATS
jgi:competence protein ComEC